MLSSDQNIETIGQLVEVLKHYISLQGEYVKLDIVEKIVRLLTALSMTVIISIFAFVVLIFLSLTAASALKTLCGDIQAYAIVAGLYVVILLLFVIFRKQWIERPLVKFLAAILLEK